VRDDLSIDVTSEASGGVSSSLLALATALRPQHWIKNLLVFAAPTAAGLLLERDVFLQTIGAFVSFSLASSAVYLVNDVCDREADRLHPLKRTRAIASGQVPVAAALVAAAVLALVALALAAAADVGLLVLIGAYLLLFLAYSVRLKQIPVLDISLIAAAFVMRAGAGGVASGIPLSSWFLVVAALGSLFVAAGKRLAELVGNEAGTRQVLEAYSKEYLRQVQLLAAAGALVAYGLWAIDRAESLPGELQSWLIQLSWAVFATGLLRYLLDVDQGHGESPETLLFRDPFLLTTALVWIGLFAGALLV
jgi:decaprenyl-phosphate phosphoribosyltransferase